LYLPLSSTSSILLASLHNNDLYPYLLSLPIDLKLKITFLSTVTIAPSYRHLSNEGWFKTSREFEDLFGGLLSPDVAARIWDIGQFEREAETIEIEVGKVRNWVHQSFASEEDQIVASTSRHSPIASGLIWDAPSDVSLELLISGRLFTDVEVTRFRKRQRTLRRNNSPTNLPRRALLDQRLSLVLPRHLVSNSTMLKKISQRFSMPSIRPR